MSKSSITFTFLLSFLLLIALGCSTSKPIASSISTNKGALSTKPGKGKVIVYRNSWIDRKAPISLFLSGELIAQDFPGYSHVVIDLAPGKYEFKVKTGDRFYKSTVSIVENDLQFFSAYVSRREGLSLDYFVMDNPRLFKVNEEVGRQSVLETSLHTQVNFDLHRYGNVLSLQKSHDGSTNFTSPVINHSHLPLCDKGVSPVHWTSCVGEIASLNGKYVGAFMDGKQNGQGVDTFWNGHKYVGEFKNGAYHGKGLFIFADNSGRAPQEGLWEDNQFVRAQRIPDHIAGRTLTNLSKQAPLQAEYPRIEPALSLFASASQPDSNGVVTLTITTNSDIASLKINGDEAGGRADGRYILKRFAQVGESKFEVVATDRFGNMLRQVVIVNREFVQTAQIIPPLNPLAVRAVKQRDAVAIVIGIEKYQSVPTADYANRDASIFVDYATRALGISRENIRLLLDDKAGAAEILLTFKNWLPTRIKRGSTDIYVFYSGHGLPSEDGQSLFLLPYEANRDLLERTAISQKEIVDAIQRTSPKSVTMFIDSCYSGQSRTGETLLASARPLAVKAKQSSFPENFTVISASAPDQISSSSPELKHGIFSYYLMRGMEGEADSNGDKQITVGEMQAYLSEQVPRQAMTMNRNQQPQVVGDQSRVLVGR